MPLLRMCIPWRLLRRYIIMNWKAFFVKWENFDKLQLIESSTTIISEWCIYLIEWEDHTISRSKGSFGDERHTTKVGYDDSSILASSLSFQSTILFRGDFLKLSHYIQYTIFLIVQSWDTNETLNLTTTILERFFQKSG